MFLCQSARIAIIRRSNRHSIECGRAVGKKARKLAVQRSGAVVKNLSKSEQWLLAIGAIALGLSSLPWLGTGHGTFIFIEPYGYHLLPRLKILPPNGLGLRPWADESAPSVLPAGRRSRPYNDVNCGRLVSRPADEGSVCGQRRATVKETRSRPQRGQIHQARAKPWLPCRHAIVVHPNGVKQKGGALRRGFCPWAAALLHAHSLWRPVGALR